MKETIKKIYLLSLILIICISSLGCSKDVDDTSPKEILWLGTSISAGESDNNYPDMISDLFSDTVTIYNEAYGNSCLRAGSWMNANENDIMGYSGIPWQSLLRSLTLESSEKIEIINNWDYWKNILVDAPEELNENDIQRYLNSSIDKIIEKYKSYNIDYIVLEHGFNDILWTLENDPDHNELYEIPENNNDRRYFIGAMQYFIDKVNESWPECEIIIAGYYENTRRPYIVNIQKYISEYFNLKIMPAWEKTGWNNKLVTVEGRWEDGIWIDTPGETQEITNLELNIPDAIHPHTDKSKSANKTLANIYYEYLKQYIYNKSLK